VEKKVLRDKGPVFLIRPVSKNLGLDYLHIALIALVIVVAALAFSLSSFKGTTVVSSLNCTYGAKNSSCVNPVHTSAQALTAAEHVIASYAVINSSLSLLPYFSMVNRSTVSFMAGSHEWLVVTPVVDPITNETLNISMLLFDSNLTLAIPFQETVRPLVHTNNTSVAFGTVSLSGKVPCKDSNPIPVYLFVDPYSVGALDSLNSGIRTASADRNLNLTYEFIFSTPSAKLYNSYGVADTQLMGKYLFCASQQRGFSAFVSNLSSTFGGTPPANYSLINTAVTAGLNVTALNGCLLSSTSKLQYQSDLASFYNITLTPQYVINCKYSALPQTLGSAINYSEANLGK
jgi:hypothetical protein